MIEKEKFLELCRKNISREGIEDLLVWLEKSDFFIAPASTRFHLNVEGGLAEHSMNVYKRLNELVGIVPTGSSLETLTIVSLFHDLCKVHCYKKDYRNVKEEGKWVQKEVFAHDEKFCYGGHGAKSVFIISQFMRLTPEEAVAIHNHMGMYDRAPGDWSLGNAFEQYPLAMLLHMADEIATRVDEKGTTV